MGKNGKLLREAKAQNTTYTFTAQQLEDHNRTIIENFKKDFRKKANEQLTKECKDYERRVWDEVNKEWEQRQQEFNSGDAQDNMNAYLQYLLAIVVKILCDQFKWTPASKDRYDRRLRITKLAESIADELARISDDETMDIRKYAAEAYEKYGVRFYYE